jgi:hypothetical protein
MRFFVGERELTACLVLPKAPWIINLPPDFRIVASRFVAGHGAVFTIWSSSFPRIARGARIPAFRPEFNGLMYCANLRRADLR